MNSADLKAIFNKLSEKMNLNKQWLIDLDSKIGDSDIGITAAKGFKESAKALNKSAQNDLGLLLLLAGKKISVSTPCTMGTLLAFGLMNAGQKMKETKEWDVMDFSRFLMFFYEGIQTLGHANLNEKTILDSLYPMYMEFMEAAKEGDSFKDAATRSALAARRGFMNTRDLMARHGKAAVYGNKTLGYEDPGAAIAVLIAETIQEYFENDYKQA